MKKISLLGLCLLAIGSASAQNDIVKQVDRALKAGNVDYAAARFQVLLHQAFGLGVAVVDGYT